MLTRLKKWIMKKLNKMHPIKRAVVVMFSIFVLPFLLLEVILYFFGA